MPSLTPSADKRDRFNNWLLTSRIGDATMETLKNLKIDVMTMDELIYAASMLTIMEKTYSDHVMSLPEWLVEKQTEIKKAIGDRRKDALLKEQKELTSRLEALKTAEEKREDLRKKLAAITSQLGG